ncbi:hypothetical protein E2P81_ATG03220 [Venturia nashicola]|nr:hypothetical protein E2P81_ATG03220 [Venturia nashicola]
MTADKALAIAKLLDKLDSLITCNLHAVFPMEMNSLPCSRRTAKQSIIGDQSEGQSYHTKGALWQAPCGPWRCDIQFLDGDEGRQLFGEIASWNPPLFTPTRLWWRQFGPQYTRVGSTHSTIFQKNFGNPQITGPWHSHSVNPLSPDSRSPASRPLVSL